MSDNRQMEIHYIDTGFPYTITQSFMDLFEGLTYAESSVGHSDPFHDQVVEKFYSFSFFCYFIYASFH
jgi:E3 ubiquitin-protein ligase BIG BROTHER and related proteins